MTRCPGAVFGRYRLEGGQVQQRVQRDADYHGPSQPLVGCLVQAGIEVKNISTPVVADNMKAPITSG